jgi:hypothetical protein
MSSQTETVLELFTCSIHNQLKWLVDRNLQLDVLNCGRWNLACCEWVDVKENAELVEKRDDAFLHS